MGGSTLSPAPSDRGSTHQVSVLTVYRYAINGMSYENEDYGTPQAVEQPMGRIELEDFIRDGGAVGTTDYCFVDPADPSRSVFRYVRPSDIESWFGPVLIGWFVCFLILLFGIYRRYQTGSW